MDLRLTGKVALVTGASVGLGRQIAKTLAEEGCRLAVLARRAHLLEALARELPPVRDQRKPGPRSKVSTGRGPLHAPYPARRNGAMPPDRAPPDRISSAARPAAA